MQFQLKHYNITRHEINNEIIYNILSDTDLISLR